MRSRGLSPRPSSNKSLDFVTLFSRNFHFSFMFKLYHTNKLKIYIFIAEIYHRQLTFRFQYFS